MTDCPASLAAASEAAAERRRGLALVAAAAVIWSSGGLIVRLLETDPWTTVFWRAAFGAVFLLGFILWRDRGRTLALFRGIGIAGVGVACCFAGASTGFVLAVENTTVAHTLVILSTAPFIAALIARLVLGERVPPRGWAAMAAALAGILLMVSDESGQATLRGDLYALASATFFSVAAVIVRKRREVRMTPATCLATVIAAGVALPLAVPLSPAVGDFGLLALFGMGQLGLGLVLFTTGARLLPAAQATLMTILETILGPLWVWIALGEHPGTHAIVGGSIVLAALAAHTALEMRATRPVRPVPPAV